MAFRTLAVTAGLALAADAFTIPSTISLPGVEVDGEGEFRALRMPDALPEQLKGLHMDVSQLHQKTIITEVTLDCPGCSFMAMKDDLREFTEDQARGASQKNDLVLGFAISDDQQTLDLNGLPLFPLRMQRGPLTAYQTLREGDDQGIPLRSLDRTLEYSAAARTVEAADGSDAQLIDLSLSVFALEDEPINVDGVDIRMLQDESGNLHLVHIIASPSHGQPQNGHTKESEVHNPLPMVDSVCPKDAGIVTMMCELRSKLMQKVNDWKLIQPNGRPRQMRKKPCPGRVRMHPESEQEASATVAVPFAKGGPAKFMPHGFRPRNHWHPHHHHHGLIRTFGRAIRGFVLGFMVPVLIGVIAGMSASLLGMLVGTLIAWLWVKLVRGGKRGNASARQEARAAMVEEEVFVGEKDGLMLEHAPAYEETNGEELPVYAERV